MLFQTSTKRDIIRSFLEKSKIKTLQKDFDEIIGAFMHRATTEVEERSASLFCEAFFSFKEKKAEFSFGQAFLSEREKVEIRLVK